MAIQINSQFKPSLWTNVVSFCDIPLVWVGVYALVNQAWLVAIVCFVGSVGLTLFHGNALAADYAKWAESRKKVTNDSVSQ